MWLALQSGTFDSCWIYYLKSKFCHYLVWLGVVECFWFLSLYNHVWISDTVKSKHEIIAFKHLHHSTAFCLFFLHCVSVYSSYQMFLLCSDVCNFMVYSPMESRRIWVLVNSPILRMNCWWLLSQNWRKIFRREKILLTRSENKRFNCRQHRIIVIRQTSGKSDCINRLALWVWSCSCYCILKHFS